jgi:hypothetical protein
MIWFLALALIAAARWRARRRESARRYHGRRPDTGWFV